MIQIRLSDCKKQEFFEESGCSDDSYSAISRDLWERLSNSLHTEEDGIWNKGLRATRARLVDKPDFSPFTNPLHPTNSWYGLFKIIFFTVTLIAPSRLLIYIVLQIINIIIAHIAGCGISEISPRECWRNPLLVLIPLVNRLILLTSGYYYIPMTGRIEKESRIIVPNHVGVADRWLIKWMFFCKGSPLDPSFIAKRSLKRTLCGILGKAELTIWVDKSSKESRQATKEAILSRTKDTRMPRLVVFPEGTTSTPDVLLKFKTGAFLPGAPVTPVCVSYLNTTGGGIQEMSFLNILDDFYFPLCNFINFVRIDILPTYHPNEREKNSPELFMENVRNVIYEELCKHFTSATLSPLTTDDWKVRNRSLKLETREQLNEFLLSDLYEKIGLKTYKTIQFVELYDELTTEGQKLSLKDFQRILKESWSGKQVEFLFEFIKNQETGAIGLLQFILFFAIITGSDINSPTKVNDLLSIAFALLADLDRNVPCIRFWKAREVMRRCKLEKFLESDFVVIWDDLEWICMNEFLSRGGRHSDFVVAVRSKIYDQFLKGLKKLAPKYYFKITDANTVCVL